MAAVATWETASDCKLAARQTQMQHAAAIARQQEEEEERKIAALEESRRHDEAIKQQILAAQARHPFSATVLGYGDDTCVPLSFSLSHTLSLSPPLYTIKS